MKNLENISKEHMNKIESEADDIVLGLGIVCLFLCSFIYYWMKILKPNLLVD